jgi:hypothetical protein
MVRTLFVAMGFTTLYLLWLIKPAIEPQQAALYHWSGPAHNFFLPVTIDFLAFWFLLALLLLAARTPGRLRATVWVGLLSFTPWFIAQTLNALDLIPSARQLDRGLFLLGILATLAMALLGRPSLPPRVERVIDSISTVLVFAGLFGLFMLCQLAFRSWQASRMTGRVPLHAAAAATIQPHRIIWIVFDELSHEQTYEHPLPGLKLPAFDSLAATATVFSQAHPFNIYTQNVLPGLFAGKPFDQIRPTPAAGLSVHNEASGEWQAFQQHDTVFNDALDAGYRTAVVGWYNPYCRIMAAVVDSCYWTYRTPSNLMEPSNTLLSNTLAPIKLLTWRVLGLAPGPMFFYFMDRLNIPLPKVFLRQSQIDDYMDLEARSQELLRDRSYGFVLLHLPVPHPWGIYDRHTGKFTTASSSSYTDNLALADKCLAGIRQTLEQTGQWDSSTVVVMGDHGWRTKQEWKTSSFWTHEDEVASHGGQYDPRPAYLVKLPNQTTAGRVDTPYQTVNTRKLFDAIMAHQINTPADLTAWAQTAH